jgi:hypothetical protein
LGTNIHVYTYVKFETIMVKKRSTINVIVVTLLLLVISSGCTAASRTDLVKSSVLNIEQQRTGKAYIAWSDVYEEDDGFVITGVLRRCDHVGVPIKTHVDITILSPDGTVLDEARSSDVYVSRRITGRGHLSFERFKVRFPSVPAQGSSARVISHSGEHNDTVKKQPRES